LSSVNLTADYLATLVTPEGAVKGAGYYVERPTRQEYDGVAQCHVADAFHRVSELNRIEGNRKAARKYLELATRIENYFKTRFWVKDQFAEYIHPGQGPVTRHGLTDTDWSSIAFNMATADQKAILWPKLKAEMGFYYNGMPTGIATLPLTYEKWESTYGDVFDLAAMGRVWYIEAAARTGMNDALGLIGTIRRVCQQGRLDGYYWRERYNDKGGYGARKYCEYPANLIRIVQRDLMGVEHELDGTLSIGPTVPDEFWKAGFGQTLSWQGRRIAYKMNAGLIIGEYSGPESQRLTVWLLNPSEDKIIRATINGKTVRCTSRDGWLTIELPASDSPCRFEISQQL